MIAAVCRLVGEQRNHFHYVSIVNADRLVNSLLLDLQYLQMKESCQNKRTEAT